MIHTTFIKIGIDAPVRNSGDVDNSPGVTLIGPAGTLELTQGLICARRHIHMTPEDAARGIILMDSVPEENEDTGGSTAYSDLSDRDVFKPYIEKEIGFKI